MKETLKLLEAARAVVKDRMDYYRERAHPCDVHNDKIVRNYLPDDVNTLLDAIEAHPLKDAHLMVPGTDVWFEGQAYHVKCLGDRPYTLDIGPLKGQSRDSWRNVPYDKLKLFHPIGG